MSVKIMARVWAHSKTKDGKLLVMLALADFSNDTGECWPSIPVLAVKARLTERNIPLLLWNGQHLPQIHNHRTQTWADSHPPRMVFVAHQSAPFV